MRRKRLEQGVARRARGLGALSLLLLLPALPASAAGARAAIPAERPPAPPPGAVRAGALSDRRPLQIELFLRPRDPAALARFVAEVSDPDSPRYGDYLAPGEFGPRFGASPETLRAVEAALRRSGLEPGPPARNRLSLPVRASAGALSRALGTDFVRYRLPGGRIAFANERAPRLPQAIRSEVVLVAGLDNLPHSRHLGPPAASMSAGGGSAPPPALPRPALAPQPCAAAQAEAAASGSYTAEQLAAAYAVDGQHLAGNFGAGRTVALFELEPNSDSDIDAYQACHGTDADVEYVQVDGGAGDGAGEGEAALDIEGIIGLAPEARIRVYQGPNTELGVLHTYQRIVDEASAQVVSTSWGICEARADADTMQAESAIFAQAAAQGQTVFAAAGDSGSSDCLDGSLHPELGLAVDDPASQPDVTGVGGTSLEAVGPPPRESVWNQGPHLPQGGGGGASGIWPMPAYQANAAPSLGVVAADSVPGCGAAYCRQVPDVAASADPRAGYVIYWDGDWLSVGGTSAAAPLWAAVTALAESSPQCGGRSLGLLNPALYAIAGGEAGGQALNDVTSGGNDVIGNHGGRYAARPGYDMASGIGTPIASGSGGAAGLIDQLCRLSVRAPAVASISPRAGRTGGGTTVTIEGSGLATATGIAFGATGAASFHCASDTACTAVSPRGSGQVHVTVRSTAGVSASTDADLFTYVQRPRRPRIRVRVNHRARRATLRFRARGSSRPVTFLCRLDGRRWSRCRSPRRYRHLRRGRHVLRVRAVDSGIKGYVARRRFRV